MTQEDIAIYSLRRANPTTLLLLHIFLGWSYGSLDEMKNQVVIYLTFWAGIIAYILKYRYYRSLDPTIPQMFFYIFGVLYILRLFTLMSAVRKYNRGVALSLGASDSDLIRLGLT
jgi:hypothetical protein